jgi:hypothetical protein
LELDFGARKVERRDRVVELSPQVDSGGFIQNVQVIPLAFRPDFETVTELHARNICQDETIMEILSGNALSPECQSRLLTILQNP